MKRVHAPKVADILADRIRERILSGDLSEGDRLPAQDDLLAEFGVGRSSLREALRMLESEGLLSIQRGNVGGAVVHRPSSETAAYTFGMVLQADAVPLNDVADALRLLEPLCTELCARREDRAEAVVPTLRAALEASLAAVDDDLEVIRQSRKFHEALAELCGNRTLVMVVGALESLWSTQEQSWAEDASVRGEFPDRPARRKALKEHERLLTLIERGDGTGAAREARKHLVTSTLYAMSDGSARSVKVTGETRSRHPGRAD